MCSDRFLSAWDWGFLRRIVMKKAVSLLTLISLIASVFVLPSCSLLGLALDAEHFPDKELRYSLRSFDSNGNG